MFPPLKNKNDLLFSITMSSPTDHKRRAQPAKFGYIHDSECKYLNNNQKINERQLHIITLLLIGLPPEKLRMELAEIKDDTDRPVRINTVLL